jgi:DNA mismatch repair protein MutS
MLIDAATRANLELTETLAGQRAGSLIAAVDRTVTGAGARLLMRRLSGPSTDPGVIERRLDSVTWMLADSGRRAAAVADLKAAPDLARALSRLTVDRGGPRDLAAIGAGLATGIAIASRIGVRPEVPEEIADAVAALSAAPADLVASLSAALSDDLPHLKRDGGFVRDGYRNDLDESRKLRDDSRRIIATLQANYATETDIRQLRIKHNNVLGYFIEVGANAAPPLFQPPLNARFIHRQTLASAVRFTTTELAELEAKIAGAGERALGIELEVFAEFVAAIGANAAAIRAVADALAVIDVAAALAALAEAEDYVRPVVDRSLAFAIDGGRHPVVEQSLKASGTPFVANSADLGPDNGASAGTIWLVTGPNMAGKSTFLRQNALIAVLAQIGSYVPAKAAHVGVVDRLFQPRRRRRRSCARPFDFHGRNGRDGGDPEPGRPARARHPRRNRPRHRDL